MEIIELTAENIEQHLDSCIDTQQYLVSNPDTIKAAYFQATAAHEAAYFMAVVEDERVIGMGVINQIVHPHGLRAYVDNIIAHPDVRGRGLFGVIMQELEEKSREWGCDRVILTCSREPVQAMYEKRGYHRKDTNYYELKF